MADHLWVKCWEVATLGTQQTVVHLKACWAVAAAVVVALVHLVGSRPVLGCRTPLEEEARPQTGRAGRGLPSCYSDPRFGRDLKDHTSRPHPDEEGRRYLAWLLSHIHTPSKQRRMRGNLHLQCATFVTKAVGEQGCASSSDAVVMERGKNVDGCQGAKGSKATAQPSDDSCKAICTINHEIL